MAFGDRREMNNRQLVAKGASDLTDTSQRTSASLCKNVRISMAFEFFLESARTVVAYRDNVCARIRCMISISPSRTDKKEQHEKESKNKPLTIQVVVPNVHIIDATVGEAWCDGLTFFLLLEHQWEEPFDRDRWDIISICERSTGCHISMRSDS